jgi:hypothetical protein
MEPIVATNSQASAKQFSCQGCGNALHITHPRAQVVACQYCGAVLDATSETHQIITRLGSPEKFQPYSFIEVGKKATLDGKTYQVMGRTRWKMQYEEFWREGSESGYSTEIWLYDEWLLMDERRTYLYLVEDKEGYWISYEITPDQPMTLDHSLRLAFFQNHGINIVQEYGEADIVYFEGESNYHLHKGDRISFASYSFKGDMYIVESRLNKQGEVTEVEFFRESPISRMALLEAFGEQETIRSLDDQRVIWSFVRLVSLVVGVVMSLLTILSFGPGKTAYEREVMVSAIGQEGYDLDDFKIPAKGLYKLKISLNTIANNSQAYLMAYIMDSSEEVLNTVEGEFYHESGVDDEGSWSESELSETMLFRTEGPGAYTIRLFADAGGAANSAATVTLYQDIMLTRYVLIGAILAFLIVWMAQNRLKQLPAYTPYRFK